MPLDLFFDPPDLGIEDIYDTDDLRSCRSCGCTDDNACVPACWWVEEDLCSTCAAGAHLIQEPPC